MRTDLTKLEFLTPYGYMNDPEFLYNAVTHVYTYRGKREPSVTGVLTELGLTDFSMIDPAVLEHAKVRGSKVHAATEQFDRGTLNWDALDPEVIGYVRAYKKFKEESEFRPLIIEQAMRSHYGFCGGVDRIGVLGGELAVIDIKTPVKSNIVYVDLQLGAYVQLGRESFVEVNQQSTVPAFELKLGKGGVYKLREVVEIDDMQAMFVYGHRIMQLKKENK